MYIIITTLIILIIFYFAETIVSMITKISTKSTSGQQIGTMWFVGLLIVNIAVIGFIYGFYYYKLSIPGNKGAAGLRGFPGIPGDDCKMEGGCSPGI